MRGLVFTTLAILIPLGVLAQDADTSGTRATHGHNSLPEPSAEPDNAQAYAPPVPYEDAPSAEDRGPAQRFFILASEPDNLAQEDNPPTVNSMPPDKLALDKRVRISLVHDVENGGPFKGGGNHALQFEIKYINWGAVTGEQMAARRGHYFTISWLNHGPRADFTAVFQYRQMRSEGIVRTLEEPMSNVRGTVRSYFAVVGRAYQTYGPVDSWRFLVKKGDAVVAETRSFIW
jgi:hypothetical protein